MVSLKPAELKFLLKLLGCENYRGAIATLSPDSKTSVAERNRTCRALHQKGLVEYDSKVGRFAIAPPGRTLLALDSKTLLLTPDEYKVLKNCRGSMTPGKLSKIPAESRQPMILSLAERGLVKITQNTIKEVWLSTKGKQFLLHDYIPSGSYLIATGNLLCNYVQFLRASLSNPIENSAVGDALNPIAPSVASSQKPDRKQLVQIIRQLDSDWNTHNRLPLFYLRDALQTQVSREELDEMLQALHQNNRLQLHPVQDSSQYTVEQLAAGLVGEGGMNLFFVTVC